MPPARMMRLGPEVVKQDEKNRRAEVQKFRKQTRRRWDDAQSTTCPAGLGLGIAKLCQPSRLERRSRESLRGFIVLPRGDEVYFPLVLLPTRLSSSLLFSSLVVASEPRARGGGGAGGGKELGGKEASALRGSSPRAVRGSPRGAPPRLGPTQAVEAPPAPGVVTRGGRSLGLGIIGNQRSESTGPKGRENTFNVRSPPKLSCVDPPRCLGGPPRGRRHTFKVALL